MRRAIFSVFVVSLLIGLTGCLGLLSEKEEPQGIVRITVAPPEWEPQSIEPKLVPAIAEKVRIRVWHPVTGYNHVVTVALANGAQTVDVPVDQGAGYFVDAVSYLMNSMPLALTGGRTTGVIVGDDDITTVNVALRQWGVTITGDDIVRPGEDYTLNFVATDAGGLITRQTFDTATLRASTVWFQDASFPLPPIAGPVVAAEDHRILLTGTAPDVTVETRLYALALVQFNQQWYDYDLQEPTERPMFLELPNRHMAGALHQLTVDPTAGGLQVRISGAE